MKEGQGFWMSVPGQSKQTFILKFGKRGPYDWEIKKVDKLIIKWVYKAVDYRLFVWYPGSAWTLVGTYFGNSKFFHIKIYIYI